ncbi:MAG: polysaccharide deacetylase family protein [Clostridiales bacterium]|nr:polysaccharide deacetylase family protein [Clostridiales bacterium]
MIKAILTIDDAPQNNTKAIVDYLCSKNIKAVFFAIGDLLDKNPENALYAISKGFVIGNHTYTHPKMSELTYEEAVEEIEKCERSLNAVYEKAGVERPVKLFRFPYLDSRKDINDYLVSKGFKKIDDSNVNSKSYIKSGCKDEIHVSVSFDCAEYLLRPGNTMTFDEITDKIDRVFGSKGSPAVKRMFRPILVNRTYIILTHSHDETEEMESEYWRKIVERVEANGAVFIDPKFVGLHA